MEGDLQQINYIVSDTCMQSIELCVTNASSQLWVQ